MNYFQETVHSLSHYLDFWGSISVCGVCVCVTVWNVDISSCCFMVITFKQEGLWEDQYNLLDSNLSPTCTRFNGCVNPESQE